MPFGKLGPLEFIIILMILAIMAIPFVIVYFFVKKMITRDIKKNYNTNPIYLAKERYAKGEISKAEFEDIKNSINEPRK